MAKSPDFEVRNTLSLKGKQDLTHLKILLLIKIIIKDSLGIELQSYQAYFPFRHPDVAKRKAGISPNKTSRSWVNEMEQKLQGAILEVILR